MTSDVRRPLSEEERDRLRAARRYGGTCAGCGRGLVNGEHVWMQPFDVKGRGVAYWWAAVGAECADPEIVRGTGTLQPAACAACGRGIFNLPAHPGRRSVACSQRCRGHAARRAKKGPRS